MKVFAYNIDLDKLDNIVNQTKVDRGIELENKALIRENNRKQLLMPLIPFAHGLIHLHNSNMKEDNTSTTGESGLLGLRKLSIKGVIDNIANDKPTFPFSHKYNNDCTLVEVKIGRKSVKIWLNCGTQHIVNPNQTYSMTTLGRDTYGTTIENELKIIAKMVAL